MYLFSKIIDKRLMTLCYIIIGIAIIYIVLMLLRYGYE